MFILSMILSLTISAAAVLITLVTASVQDAVNRTVYVATWYPATGICLVCTGIYWVSAVPENIPFLIVSLATAVLMLIFGIFGFFGKADAKALILVSLAVPVSPFVNSLFPSLAVSALLNACMICIFISAGFLVYNLLKGNKAPFMLMCSGYPVNGRKLLNHHGFIAENVHETNGTIEKTFKKPGSSVRALKTESESMIRILREHQDKYKDRLDLYARCGSIWISAGIPFLIPVTLGFTAALFGFSVTDWIAHCIF